MNNKYVAQEQSRQKNMEIINIHYYCAEIFYHVIDMQLHELDNRFSKTNIDLLLYIACLSPNNKISTYNQQKLRCLTEFYPYKFLALDYIFDSQLNI